MFRNRFPGEQGACCCKMQKIIVMMEAGRPAERQAVEDQLSGDSSTNIELRELNLL